jgi:hypothetical protein
VLSENRAYRDGTAFCIAVKLSLTLFMPAFHGCSTNIGNGISAPAAAQGTPQDPARTPAPSSTPSQPHSQPQRRPSAGSTSSLFSKHPHHGIGGNSSGALQVSGIRLRNMKYRGTGLFGGLVGCFVQCSVNNFVKRTKAETVSCLSLLHAV